LPTAYTPSDFPLAKLTQKFLDSLRETNGRIEDIYPLTSMQEDMLFQTLRARGKAVYFEQLSFAVEGLKPEIFRLAWQQVADKYPPLRSRFAWEGVERPVQIVDSHVEIKLEHEDWVHLEEAKHSGQLEDFLLRDRTRGFDLKQSPSMRLTLIHKQHSDSVVWSFHHILLDGWSGPILMQEVFTRYCALCRGEQPPSEASADYTQYIRWLQRQNTAEMEQFWRARLANFPGATELGLENADEHSSRVDVGREAVQFSDDTVQTLEIFVRSQQLTLNTLIQGMWSVLLSGYSGKQEVVFGAWGSGRSAEVSEIEKIVGALITTLPVRIQIDEEAGLASWLQKIQEQQFQQRQYEHVDLLKLMEWSGVARELLLFKSVLVFENYPMATSVDGQIAESGLRIFDVQAREQTHYPVTIRVMPRNNLMILMEYDPGIYTAENARQILTGFQKLLQTVAVNPAQRIKDLLPIVRIGK
jgi:hypothetical protein